MAYCTLCYRTFCNVSSLNQHLIDPLSHKHQGRDEDGANLSLSDERGVNSLHVDSGPAPITGVPMLLSRLSLNAPTKCQGEDPVDAARVSAAAERSRFRDLTPALIMHHTQTTLDVGIVRSIIKAAVRLIPAHNTNTGTRRSCSAFRRRIHALQCRAHQAMSLLCGTVF